MAQLEAAERAARVAPKPTAALALGANPQPQVAPAFRCSLAAAAFLLCQATDSQCSLVAAAFLPSQATAFPRLQDAAVFLRSRDAVAFRRLPGAAESCFPSPGAAVQRDARATQVQAARVVQVARPNKAVKAAHLGRVDPVTRVTQDRSPAPSASLARAKA